MAPFRRDPGPAITTSRSTSDPAIQDAVLYRGGGHGEDCAGGRYAELFEYDAARGEITLPDFDQTEQVAEDALRTRRGRRRQGLALPAAFAAARCCARSSARYLTICSEMRWPMSPSVRMSKCIMSPYQAPQFIFIPRTTSSRSWR
jgi:hypothetical protein